MRGTRRPRSRNRAVRRRIRVQNEMLCFRSGGLPVKYALKIIWGACLLSGASHADAAWRKFETAHFIVYSESNDKRATELATGLENIDGLMRMATGLPMASEAVKVRIYEMADEGQVQAAIGGDNE